MSRYENRLIAADQYLFYIAKITTTTNKKEERIARDIKIFTKIFQAIDVMNGY